MQLDSFNARRIRIARKGKWCKLLIFINCFIQSGDTWWKTTTRFAVIKKQNSAFFSPNVTKNRLHRQHSFIHRSSASCTRDVSIHWCLTPVRLFATTRCASSLQQAQSLLLLKQIVHGRSLSSRRPTTCCCRFYSATCPDWTCCMLKYP